MAAVFALVAAGSALAAAAACLPEPDAVEPVDVVDAGPNVVLAPTGPYCGDGVIETLDDGGDAGESCDPGDGGFTGCTHCQWECPEGRIYERTGHCYYLAPLPAAAYTAAETACGSSAHVVTVTTPDEAAFVTKLADGSPYWLGLELGPGGDFLPSVPLVPPRLVEPGYPGSTGETCPGCFAAIDGGVLPPLDDGGVDLICVAAVGGAWFRVPCTPSTSDAGVADGGVTFPTLRALCEREPPGQRAFLCGGPFCTTLQATRGTKRYVIGLVSVTSSQAATLCAGYADGGRLVTFETAEEREQLARELAILVPPLAPPGDNNEPVPPPVTAWIGLALDDAGTWTWDDGVPASDASPLPWAGFQPSGAGAGRAFLRLRTDGDNYAYDISLVASDDTDDAGSPPLRFYLCERPPG